MDMLICRIFAHALNAKKIVQLAHKIIQINALLVLMDHIYLKILVFHAIKVVLPVMVHQQYALYANLVPIIILHLHHVKIVLRIAYNAINPDV